MHSWFADIDWDNGHSEKLCPNVSNIRDTSYFIKRCTEFVANCTAKTEESSDSADVNTIENEYGSSSSPFHTPAGAPEEKMKSLRWAVR